MKKRIISIMIILILIMQTVTCSFASDGSTETAAESQTVIEQDRTETSSEENANSGETAGKKETEGGKTYTVTLNDPDHGSIAFKDKAGNSAAYYEGDIVSMTADLDEDYTVANVKAAADDGSVISLAMTDNGKEDIYHYEFQMEMPASNVTVSIETAGAAEKELETEKEEEVFSEYLTMNTDSSAPIMLLASNTYSVVTHSTVYTKPAANYGGTYYSFYSNYAGILATRSKSYAAYEYYTINGEFALCIDYGSEDRNVEVEGQDIDRFPKWQKDAFKKILTYGLNNPEYSNSKTYTFTSDTGSKYSGPISKTAMLCAAQMITWEVCCGFRGNADGITWTSDASKLTVHAIHNGKSYGPYKSDKKTINPQYFFNGMRQTYLASDHQDSGKTTRMKYILRAYAFITTMCREYNYTDSYIPTFAETDKDGADVYTLKETALDSGVFTYTVTDSHYSKHKNLKLALVAVGGYDTSGNLLGLSDFSFSSATVSGTTAKYTITCKKAIKGKCTLKFSYSCLSASERNATALKDATNEGEITFYGGTKKNGWQYYQSMVSGRTKLTPFYAKVCTTEIQPVPVYLRLKKYKYGDSGKKNISGAVFTLYQKYKLIDSDDNTTYWRVAGYYVYNSSNGYYELYKETAGKTRLTSYPAYADTSTRNYYPLYKIIETTVPADYTGGFKVETVTDTAASVKTIGKNVNPNTCFLIDDNEDGTVIVRGGTYTGDVKASSSASTKAVISVGEYESKPFWLTLKKLKYIEDEETNDSIEPEKNAVFVLYNVAEKNGVQTEVPVYTLLMGSDYSYTKWYSYAGTKASDYSGSTAISYKTGLKIPANTSTVQYSDVWCLKEVTAANNCNKNLFYQYIKSQNNRYIYLNYELGAGKGVYFKSNEDQTLDFYGNTSDPDEDDIISGIKASNSDSKGAVLYGSDESEASVRIRKVDQDGNPIKNVTFCLYKNLGTSDPGTITDMSGTAVRVITYGIGDNTYYFRHMEESVTDDNGYAEFNISYESPDASENNGYLISEIVPEGYIGYDSDQVIIDDSDDITDDTGVDEEDDGTTEDTDDSAEVEAETEDDGIHAEDVVCAAFNVTDLQEVTISAYGTNDKFSYDSDTLSDGTKVINQTVNAAYKNASGTSPFNLTFVNHKKKFSIKLGKVSGNESITKDNPCYSLKDAEYVLYKGSYTSTTTEIPSDAVELKNYKTDEDGNFTVTDLDVLDNGNAYYVRESKNSKGFGLDASIYAVIVQIDDNGKLNYMVYNITKDKEDVKDKDYIRKPVDSGIINMSEPVPLTSTEPPLDDPLALKLIKSSMQKPDKKLPGAVFALSYYENTDGNTDGNAVKTWYFKTDSDGKLYFDQETYMEQQVKTSDGSELTSDKLYYYGDKIVYPLGTYTIREVTAPDGYKLEGTMNFSGNDKMFSITDGVKVIVKEESDGNVSVYSLIDKVAAKIESTNMTIKAKDEEIPGSITVFKFAPGKKKKTPLAGVTFKLTADDGTETVKKTDADGKINFESLSQGTYTLTETSTVDGYSLLKDSIKITIPKSYTSDEVKKEKIDTEDAVYDVASDTYTFYNLYYEIGNEASFELPHTGGNNRMLYLLFMFGIGALSFARWMFIKNKTAR